MKKGEWGLGFSCSVRSKGEQEEGGRSCTRVGDSLWFKDSLRRSVATVYLALFSLDKGGGIGEEQLASTGLDGAVDVKGVDLLVSIGDDEVLFLEVCVFLSWIPCCHDVVVGGV